MAKRITKTDVKNSVMSMSLSDLRKLNVQYAKLHNLDIDESMNKLLVEDLQNRIINLRINQSCPSCGSIHIKKNGFRNHIQRYQCTKCGKKFTPFTNTFLEKTKWHWDIWVELIHCMLNNISLKDTQKILIDDYQTTGIDIKTIFYWRHKVMEACKSVELPHLKGIIQIDETHFHEVQKGSRSLINFFDENEVRNPRRRKQGSKYGVMGAEYSTIICAVDKTGHLVAKASGLGKFDVDRFETLFRSYILDAKYLCTDANNNYLKYTSKYNIPHYVRPSTYLQTLTTSGNNKTKEQLYNDGLLDYIAHTSKLSYKKFAKLKKDNDLTLSAVNGVHNELKHYINGECRGVSTKHLESYIAWFNMITNYRVDHKHKPSSKKDAEDILIMLLRAKTNVLYKELQAKQMTLPKPSKKYLKALKANTDAIRAKYKGNSFFKYNSEDAVETFNKRDIIDKLNISELRELCKMCKISGYSKIKKDSTYKYRRELEKSPLLEEALQKMWTKYK